MSHDTLEQAVLSGALFRDPSAALDEYRPEDRSTPSPEPNTDDELGSDYSPPSSPRVGAGASAEQSRSTGVKGVLRDHRASAARAREEQVARRLLAAQALEERALLAPTWEEDEELRAAEHERQDRGPHQRDVAAGGAQLNGASGGGRRGYLREVSAQGYLSAVENAPGWVVILVFEPDITNLSGDVLLALQSLASAHPPPQHAFLLARASTLDFMLRPDGTPDKDVLPSMLVYAPGGRLKETFIRVDLELRKRSGGVEGLLRRHGVLSRHPRKDDDVADVSGSDEDDGYDD